MKILFAIEVDGNPLWTRNEYDLVMFDTKKKESKVITWDVLPNTKHKNGSAHEFYFTDKGVEGQYFACGSGYGKAPIGERFLAIPRSDYAKLVIVECEEKRERERNFDGNWRDNSDFEPGGMMERLAKAERPAEPLPPNVAERIDYVGLGLTMDSVDQINEDLNFQGRLKVPVNVVRWNYPFEVKEGSYNLYPIEEVQRREDLLRRIIEVFQQEYTKHENELNHELSDYIIELLDIHPNGLATVCFGS